MEYEVRNPETVRVPSSDAIVHNHTTNETECLLQSCLMSSPRNIDTTSWVAAAQWAFDNKRISHHHVKTLVEWRRNAVGGRTPVGQPLYCKSVTIQPGEIGYEALSNMTPTHADKKFLYICVDGKRWVDLCKRATKRETQAQR